MKLLTHCSSSATVSRCPLLSVSLSCKVPHISLWHKFLHMAMHISCCVYIMLINFYFSVIKNTKSLSSYCSVLLLIITFQQIFGTHTHMHTHSLMVASIILVPLHLRTTLTKNLRSAKKYNSNLNHHTILCTS